MQCRKCHRKTIVKNGMVRNRQRYKCSGCGFTFTQKHANGWPSDSKMLIVMNHCMGESISALAKDSGASPVSVLRWIEEARESLTTGGEMVDWVSEALMDSVGLALAINDRPLNVNEVSDELLSQIEWWNMMFTAQRSGDGTFLADYEAMGWVDKSRPPTDAELTALVTKKIEDITDKVRKSGWKSLSTDE